MRDTEQVLIKTETKDKLRIKAATVKRPMEDIATEAIEQWLKKN